MTPFLWRRRYFSQVGEDEDRRQAGRFDFIAGDSSCLEKNDSILTCCIQPVSVGLRERLRVGRDRVLARVLVEYSSSIRQFVRLFSLS